VNIQNDPFAVIFLLGDAEGYTSFESTQRFFLLPKMICYVSSFQANVILKMNEDENAPTVELRNQPFASPEKLHDVTAETYRLLKNKVPVILRAMVLYLANKDTEYILFKPIKVS
jgi:hypothetical protein